MTVPTRRRWLPHRLGGRCGRVSRPERSAGQSAGQSAGGRPRLGPTAASWAAAEAARRGACVRSPARQRSASSAWPRPRRPGRAAPPAQAGQPRARGTGFPARPLGTDPQPPLPTLRRPAPNLALRALSADLVANGTIVLRSPTWRSPRRDLRLSGSATASAASRSTVGQSAASTTSLGATQDPPRQATFLEAPGTTAPSRRRCPRSGRSGTCGSGSPKLFRNATPPDASAGNSFWRRPRSASHGLARGSRTGRNGRPMASAASRAPASPGAYREPAASVRGRLELGPVEHGASAQGAFRQRLADRADGVERGVRAQRDLEHGETPRANASARGPRSRRRGASAPGRRPRHRSASATRRESGLAV